MFILTESQDEKMRDVRVGIIGCGGIANGKHMPSLKKLDNVKMVAFCDIIPERAEKAAKEYGEPDAATYIDYHDLLARDDIEVVHVLTPNIAHAEISIAALKAGKHVMCEKPMAINYAEAKAMCKAAKESGKLLTIGYQSRSTPAYQYVRHMVDRGDLGDVYYLRVPSIRRRGVPLWGVFLDKEKQGGGPLIDCGTHSIDKSLYMINNYDVVSVTGASYRKLADTAMYSNDWGIWDPKDFEVEDFVSGWIRFRNGTTMSLEVSWLLNFTNERNNPTFTDDTVILCGSKGGVEFRGDGTIRVNGEKDGALYTQDIQPNMTSRDLFKGQHLSAQEYEAKQWIYSVVNNVPPITKPEEACMVSRIIEALYESARTGKTIYFDEQDDD